jgi:hypothetical protein
LPTFDPFSRILLACRYQPGSAPPLRVRGDAATTPLADWLFLP